MSVQIDTHVLSYKEFGLTIPPVDVNVDNSCLAMVILFSTGKLVLVSADKNAVLVGFHTI